MGLHCPELPQQWKGENNAHLRGWLGGFSERIHVIYSRTIVLFFSLTSVMLCGNHFRVRPLASMRSASGEINQVSSFGVKVLSSHISKACSPYSFSTIQEGASSDISWEVTCFWELLSSLFQGEGGEWSLARALDLQPVGLLPGSSGFRTHPSLALSHLEGILIGTSWPQEVTSHLSYCSKVVINSIEAEWWRGEGCRHWSQTNWVWFLDQPLSS